MAASTWSSATRLTAVICPAARIQIRNGRLRGPAASVTIRPPVTKLTKIKLHWWILIGIGIGTILGFVSGYYGGSTFDNIVTAVVDVVLTMPAFLILVLIASSLSLQAFPRAVRWTWVQSKSSFRSSQRTSFA